MHVTDTLALGGKERVLVDIANATVAGQKFDVSVCVTRSGIALAKELRRQIYAEVLNRKFKFDLFPFFRFSTFANKADILHIHSRSTFLFLSCARILGFIKRPIILHDHYGLIESDTSVPFWFPYIKKYADQYVGVSEKLGEWAHRSGMAEDKISVIPNALDFTRFHQSEDLIDIRKTYNISSGDILGIAIANIRPEKGIDLLIDAVKALKKAPRFKLLIIGHEDNKKYAKSCQLKVSQLGLSRKIFFVGRQLNTLAFLKAADIALLPSLSESGPLVLIEYMASGLSFVYSRVGNIGNQLAKLGVPGCVPVNDTENFAGALEELLALSPKERTVRGDKGREVGFEYFDIQSIMPRWYELYEKVAPLQP